jgi:CrcB protein
MNVALAIFLGGGLGSLSRYGVSKLVMQIWSGKFPLGTLLANLFSCIVMGLVISYFSDKITSQELKAFLLIGFCGGFSTFSTFSKETLDLVQSGNYLIAIANIIISLLFCFLILWFLTSRPV